MKRIKLSERSPDGKIFKNESYDPEELKDIVYKMRYGFFRNILLGLIRKRVLTEIFDVFDELIDLDKPGTHRVKLRKKA